MTPLDVFYIAAGAWAAAALAGLLAALPSARAASGLRVCCALSALGGAAAMAGGGWSLLYGDTTVVSPGGQTITGGPLQLQATSLAGVFAALLGVVAVAIACYAPRYHPPSPGTGLYLAAYHVALLASLAVLAAGGMVTFLIAWETMSLACYLLILRHPRDLAVARGAFWFLALSEAGFLLVVAAFVILSSKTGFTTLAGIAAHAGSVPGGWRATAFLLALVGFGFKAGLVPLHVWLPEAPGGPRRRVGVPVRRGRQVGRVRHRAVRVPARSARRHLAGPGHHGRRRGDRGDRHPLRDGRAGHQAVPRLLHDREHRHYRDRVRRRHDLPRQRPAGPVGVPADRRDLPRGEPRLLQDPAVPRGRRHRARGRHQGHGPARRSDPPPAALGGDRLRRDARHRRAPAAERVRQRMADLPGSVPGVPHRQPPDRHPHRARRRNPGPDRRTGGLRVRPRLRHPLPGGCRGHARRPRRRSGGSRSSAQGCSPSPVSRWPSARPSCWPPWPGWHARSPG